MINEVGINDLCRLNTVGTTAGTSHTTVSTPGFSSVDSQVINRWITFTSDIQHFMFRGRFVAGLFVVKKWRPAWNLSLICFGIEIIIIGYLCFLIIIIMDSF